MAIPTKYVLYFAYTSSNPRGGVMVSDDLSMIESNDPACRLFPPRPEDGRKQPRTGNQKRWNATVSPAITIETIDISLIRMLSDGPEVSLKGSPTVSPTTVALWQSEPLPP